MAVGTEDSTPTKLGILKRWHGMSQGTGGHDDPWLQLKGTATGLTGIMRVPGRNPRRRVRQKSP